MSRFAIDFITDTDPPPTKGEHAALYEEQTLGTVDSDYSDADYWPVRDLDSGGR